MLIYSSAYKCFQAKAFATTIFLINCIDTHIHGTLSMINLTQIYYHAFSWVTVITIKNTNAITSLLSNLHFSPRTLMSPYFHSNNMRIIISLILLHKFYLCFMIDFNLSQTLSYIVLTTLNHAHRTQPTLGPFTATTSHPKYLSYVRNHQESLRQLRIRPCHRALPCRRHEQPYPECSATFRKFPYYRTKNKPRHPKHPRLDLLPLHHYDGS